MPGAPLKIGLSYFSLDTDISQDDKVLFLEAKHGVLGFGILIKLLCKIYRNGYYLKWGEREALLFAKQNNIDINTVNNLINDAINEDFFSQKIHKKYSILTSRGIQKRYLAATTKRKRVEIIEEISLIDINDYNNVIYVGINSINGVINLKNSPKVKESKVKENKVKKKYAEFVSMTEEEYQKLIAQYGEKSTEKMIHILDNYKGATGKKYKNDYRAILSWVVDKITVSQRPTKVVL